MHLILSRKGWDGGTGRIPSPIFPSGAMVSLPIPIDHGRPITQHGQHDLASVIRDLSHDAFAEKQNFHFDPDLQGDWWPRDSNWRPAFGQTGAAEAHLRNQNVDTGDVFLFFGWFRHVKKEDEKWCYEKRSSTHSLFGWLQIDARLRIPSDDRRQAHRYVRELGYGWLRQHPHVEFCNRMGNNNTIYVASTELVLEGWRTGLPGAGAFRRWDPELQLTASGQELLTLWRLPAWWPAFHSPNYIPLSYHKNPNRWSQADRRTHVRSVSRGQEFVIDVTGNQGAMSWIADLIRRFA